MKIAFFEVENWEKKFIEKNFPNATITHDKLTSQNAERFKAYDILSCFIYSEVTEEILKQLSSLKLIAVRATGFDNVDIHFCKEKKIAVANVPEYGSKTVAEYTFALILTLTRKIYQSVNHSKSLNFTHDDIRGIDLTGKTIGIVGLGKIGEQVAHISKAFGMNILANTHTKNEQLGNELGIQFVDLPTLLSNSDIITLHVPLTDTTKHMINRDNILKIKPHSYLINTARGGLIETQALVEALDKEILAGAALDVLEEEDDLLEEVEVLASNNNQDEKLKTLIGNHMLMNHPKVILTPHNAFNTEEALQRILTTSCENIKNFEKGSATNTI